MADCVSHTRADGTDDHHLQPRPPERKPSDPAFCHTHGEQRDEGASEVITRATWSEKKK